MTEILPLPHSGPSVSPQDGADRTREVAKQLEATFLAEMLKSAGFGEQENSFTGSAGEDQFASFQREALATQMVENGGIGLAEAFYRAITER